MASVESVSVSNNPQAKGDRYVVYSYELLDNLGALHYYSVGPKSVASGFDADTDANTLDILGQLAESEEVSEDPLNDALSPRWATTKQIAKKAIYRMMEERDPRFVLYLEPLIRYIQQNYNATQVASLLDMTTEQVVKMNNRVKSILDAPVTAASVKDLLADFDAEEGI